MSFSFQIVGRPWLLPAIVIVFAIVHIVKMMRLYLIFLDERIGFARFVYLYFATTLVNLIIPFKLGEFFRMFVFYRETGSGKTGCTGVLCDRFFDTMALVLILLPLEVLTKGTVTYTTLLLSAFIVVFIFLYRVYASSYLYLNRYVIMRKTSKRSLNALKVLEAGMSVRTHVKKLIEGRYALLILFSFIAWLMECFAFYLTAMYLSLPMTDNLSTYISSLVLGSKSYLSRIYVILCVIIIGIGFIISAVVMTVGRRMETGNGKNNRNI